MTDFEKALADLRARRDHYNETEGDGMEDMLQALDAFLDQPPSTDFERGAEAMREAAARQCDHIEHPSGLGMVGDLIRALPLSVQPPGSESREARLERENTRLTEKLAHLDMTAGRDICARVEADRVKLRAENTRQAAEVERLLERGKALQQSRDAAIETNTRHVVLVEQLSDALLQFVCTNCDTPFVANGPVLRVESRGCDECAPTRGALMDALKLRRPASDNVPFRPPAARPEEKK